MNKPLFLLDYEIMTITQASIWASELTGRNITTANILYLIKYGRVLGTNKNGIWMVKTTDLEQYYRKQNKQNKNIYRHNFDDINWHLSFEQYKESNTTKHVHKLHPYKGKFIPQLAEYFLDTHTDEFKTESYFSPGDIVLDPFCGSGTTLVQANELGIHGIGIDVSIFNTMISNLKLSKIDLNNLMYAAMEVDDHIASDQEGQKARDFGNRLLAELKIFNMRYFPTPNFRLQIRRGEIDFDKYTKDKSQEFLKIYMALLKKYNVNFEIDSDNTNFIENWYCRSIRSEMKTAKKFIEEYPDYLIQNMLRLILSRTIRSCRATSHYDLATLAKPVTEPYFCKKHSKICKPVFSMLDWWRRYYKDTVIRIGQFDKLRSNTMQICIDGDSRDIDIITKLEYENPELVNLVQKQKIRGMFSSPPYLGMIDYHNQHAYAYELFGLVRNERNEIGSLSRGQGQKAQTDYIEGISNVLINCQKYMCQNYNVFLVSNDKFGLYPTIAARAGMKIYKKYNRPVLKRAEADGRAYSETIFHLRKKN